MKKSTEMAIIVNLDSSIRREILSILSDLRAEISRDHYWGDDYKLVGDLDIYSHWLVTNLSLIYNKTYIPSSSSIPSLEIEQTVDGLLSRYSKHILNLVSTSSEFPDRFTVVNIDSNSIMIRGVE